MRLADERPGVLHALTLLHASGFASAMAELSGGSKAVPRTQGRVSRFLAQREATRAQRVGRMFARGNVSHAKHRPKARRRRR